MDPLLILIAFVFGFAVYRVGLPPLVGYLIAGFVLQALGIQGGEHLETIADLSVILLLFTIGLKLKLKTLARRTSVLASLSLANDSEYSYSCHAQTQRQYDCAKRTQRSQHGATPWKHLTIKNLQMNQLVSRRV